MTEIAFPLLGSAFVVLIGLPACAIVACAVLAIIERCEARGALHGLGPRYAVLVGSSFLPVAWLLSAGTHQAETGRFVLACLFDHHAAELCLEPLLFVTMLASALLVSASRTLRGSGSHARATDPAALRTAVRIARIVAGNATLRGLARRIVVTRDARIAISAVGIVRPSIMVDAVYAGQLGDDELLSALGHEAEHVRARDPLRYFVLSLALAINPFGRWLLDAHAERWVAARETHCDREAVIHGASPLALAGALVRAARPVAAALPAALGACEAKLVRLRVELLFAFLERPPAHCCRREPSSMPAIIALLVLAAVLPHQAGTAALDVLHVGSEQLLHVLFR